MTEPRIVVLGDIGGVGGYHVGDEAMLEAALSELAARGIDRCTVLSPDPVDSSTRYGVESILPFGFAQLATESERDARLRRLLSGATSPHAFDRDDPALRIRDALAASTAAVVTGGGNLTATWPHHVYERAALVGMARRLGNRVVLTGQGIGPDLDRRCGELVSSIVVGTHRLSVRDRQSLALVAQLGHDVSRVSLTPDDAAFLPGTQRPDLLAHFGLAPSQFVAATFSDYAGALDPDDFLSHLARLIDGLVDKTGMPVALVPHHGRQSPVADADVGLHARLVPLCGPSVFKLPVLPARETGWITGQAAMVVSSRYHPIVFGLAAAVPSVGLAVDEYTHQKISGALGQSGMGDWCLPSVALEDGLVAAALAECWTRRDEIRDHLGARLDGARTAAQVHWGSVAAFILGSPEAGVVRVPDVVDLPPLGTWAARATEIHQWADRLARRDAARRRELDAVRAETAVQDGATRRVSEELATALDRIALLEGMVSSEQAAAEAARDRAGEALDELDHRRNETFELRHELVGLRNELIGLRRQAQALQLLQETKLLRWSTTPRRHYSRLRRRFGDD